MTWKDVTWEEGVGRIDKDMIEKHMFPPSNSAEDDSLIIFLCGPIKFNKAMKNYLGELGYDKQRVFTF